MLKKRADPTPALIVLPTTIVEEDAVVVEEPRLAPLLPRPVPSNRAPLAGRPGVLLLLLLLLTVTFLGVVAVEAGCTSRLEVEDLIDKVILLARDDRVVLPVLALVSP